MGPLVGETELTEALLQAGKDLLRPYYSTDSIFDLLNKVESLLLAVEQDPIAEVRNALKPSMQALVSADLLRHPDSDVRVHVVSCLTEIMRITAPEAPYNDDQMKEVFEVTVEAFGKLADASCESYKKAEAVLDTVAKVRSSLVMLDLECDELILEMFRQFLKIIRLSPDCPQTVLVSMETIMVTVIDESEEVSMDLLAILLGPVRKESLDVSPVASRLVEKVLISCASKLRPDIMDALKSTGTSLDMYSPVVSSICQSGAATTEAQIIVNPTETEAEGKISEEQVVPDDSLQEKLDLGLSPKGIRSKRTARGGARAIGDDNVKNGDGLKQVLKQGQSESTEGETESGSTRRRRKPNSLLNPEEGYSFKTSSSIKKVHEKELGAAKKASLPTKVGQTNQSVVISLSPSSKARKGSRKRSRSKMEETDLDAGSVATPASKKQIVKKDEPEEDSTKTAKEKTQKGSASKKQIVKKDEPEEKEDIMETSLEKPEDSTKTAKSSKKEKAQKGSASKKQIVKKDDAEEEEDFMETDLEKPEESTKTAKSSKKEREEKGSTKSTAKKPLAESKKEKAQKGSAKTAAKKPPAESKKEIGENGLAKTSAKKPLEKSVHSDAKKKNSEGASMESSKSKKKNSRAMTPPTKESEQTLKSHPKRKRTAREEVESNKSEHGEELVGKSVKVWWPLDKKFYDGVIKSYSSLNKKHQVLYSDGDSEELNLKKERWEIISEEKEETDLPDSTPLSDIMRRNKAKKRKTESMHVQLKSSSEVRSSKKKDLVTSSTKQGKATKDAVKGGSDEPERREEINLQFPKDCVDKEESETKRLPKESNAEAKSDGEELKSANKLTAETGNDGEEQEVEKEATAEPQTDGEERESVKVLNEAKSDGEELKTANKATAESKIEGEEQGVEKEATAEPQTNGGERESVKEPNEEAETEVQVRDSAKEPTADTNLIEEGRSEEKETGKVENVTEEEEQKIVKELEEDTDKAEGGTIPVSG